MKVFIFKFEQFLFRKYYTLKLFVVFHVTFYLSFAKTPLAAQ